MEWRYQLDEDRIPFIDAHWKFSTRNIEPLNLACPVKFIEDKERSEFNWGTSEPLNPEPILMVGYNRRFSPLTKIIKEKFGDGPMAMTYRVNAGAVPLDSWIYDPDFGGGRILGEVSHFVDTLTFLSGSLPVSVFANVMDDAKNLYDTLNISLSYQNGSIGTISYFANGNKRLSKERIEIFSHGSTAVIEHFKSLTLYSNNRIKK